jgi:amino acid adenylation domain-containing protein/non-ribosomal peptide synthase protein (TIGR01720 family)
MEQQTLQGYPLSPAQQRLWELQGSSLDLPYRAWWMLETAGTPQIDRLWQAVQRTVERHEILRTHFTPPPLMQQTVQVVREALPPRLVVQDLRTLSSDLQSRVAQEEVERWLAQPIDCASDPVLHMLVLLQAETTWLVVGLPGLCADRAALRNLMDEVACAYAGEEHDREVLQYPDVSAWFHEILTSEEARDGRRFWRSAGGWEATRLDLALEERRTPVWQAAPRRCSQPLNGSLGAALAARAEELGIGLSTLLLVAWQALLLRQSDALAVTVGTAFPIRRYAELETALGLFMRYLPVTAEAAGGTSFAVLVRQVAERLPGVEVWQEAFCWDDLDGLAAAPGFDFGFDGIWAEEVFAAGDLRWRLRDGDVCVEPFKLRLSVWQGEGSWTARCAFAPEHFASADVECLLDQYEALLIAVAADPTVSLEAIELSSAAWRHRLLAHWSGEVVDHGSELCLHQLFEAQRKRTPDHVALEAGSERATYAEIEAAANRLAHRLRELGAGTESLVGICLARSFDSIVSILATLKAGAAYVPLDPSYPTERLAWMLADSGARIVITDDVGAERLAPAIQRVVRLDEEAANLAALSGAPLGVAADPEQLAYVIYTSGSTGRPKGVMVSHRAIVNRLLWMQRALPLDERDAVLQKTPISFDPSIWEIFVPLASGARVVLIDADGHRDAELLADTVARYGVTVLQLVPSFLRVFVEADGLARCRGLRHLFCGGELLPLDLAEQVRTQIPAELHNLYGPTEAAIDACHFLHDGTHQLAGVPIGRPIDNVRVYLLDERFEPVPVGRPGEIHIGGRGLARGYYGRPDLSADRFVPDPFSGSEPGGRLYRTGDLARYLSDGTLEFLGRRDHQVKIRGVRVELGEVEALLRAHPQVADAAVVASESKPGDRRLVAYVVPARGRRLTAEDLFRHTRNSFPEPLQPAAFVLLDALPLTPTGKIDRRALPASQGAAIRESVHVAPATPVERTLARIWSEVLEVPRIGIHDNFFELGGDSILSLQILSRAARAGIRLSARQMFQKPTIAELAAVAETAPEADLVHSPVVGEVPLTPIQRRFFELGLEEAHHWNQSVLLSARQALDPGRLAAALARLLDHHDALRLRYTLDERVEQHLPPFTAGSPLAVVDLGALPEERRRDALRSAATQAQASLDLERGPLVRFALFRQRGGEDLALFVAHHLAMDGVSWRVLLEDLETAFRQTGGEPVTLPPKTTSFKAWAEKLLTYAGEETALRELAFWQANVAGLEGVPYDREPAAASNREASARSVGISLSAEGTQALLRDVPSVYRLQVTDLLLAALLRTFHAWSGRHDLWIDLEGHGREELFEGVDLSRTVGWFTSLFPVHLTVESPDAGPGAWLMSVKEQLRLVPGRGIGYGVLRHLSPGFAGEALRAVPAPAVSFNYLGQFDSLLQNLGLFVPVAGEIGPNRGRHNRRAYVFDINGIIADGRLEIAWGYSADLHTPETVEWLAGRFRDEILALVRHCQTPEAFGFTPSDFPLARLDAATVNRLVGGDRAIEDIYPLSPLQRGLLLHSLERPSSGVYFQQLSCWLHGPLDVPAFATAWRKVVERYETLRTSFIWEDLAEPVQIVRRGVPLEIHLEDWRLLDSVGQARRLQTFLEEERRLGFDPGQAPLMRLHLFRVGEESHRLVWSHHHLILDGWSVPVLIGEVFTHYEAAHRGAEAPAKPPRRYRDYIEWLAGQDLDAAEEYWRALLAGFRSPTKLPVDRPAGTGEGELRVEEEAMLLGEELTGRLRLFTQDHRLTLNTLLQGAWALLLGRYSGEDDVVFGAVSSGRPPELADVDRMVGLFINTLPVRVRAAGGTRILDWLHALQERQAEMRQYEFTPLSSVQEWSEVRRGHPLFETLFVFENFPLQEMVEEQARTSLAVRGVRFEERTNYPLALMAVPGARLSVRLSYDSQRFDRLTLRRALSHLEALLDELVAQAGERLDAVIGLPSAERHQILVEWNATDEARLTPGALSDPFLSHAAAAPDRVAIVADHVHLSYGGLERVSARIASHLSRRGAGPDRPVGVCLRRSAELIAGLLGILRAGAAYMPLDPHHPASRLGLMLADAAVDVVLTERGLRERLPDGPFTTVCVEDLQSAEGGPALPPVAPDQLAYLIYTSGSTGRPKGVAIEHHSARELLAWAATVYGVADLGGVLAVTPLSFDLSVFEIFVPLSQGGTVIVAESAVELASLPAAWAVTLVNTVPSALAALFRAGGIPESVRVVNLAGEPLPGALVQETYRYAGVERVFNLYGPSEDTTYSTGARLERGSKEPPRIGRPLANTRGYVLDARLRPLPIGVPGEFCLASSSLARGYLGRADLTAERFVPDPFGPSGARLYRTGDLVRHAEDGTLTFLGRVDHQVKVQGVRIELGEIEAALLQHPAVGAAAAAVQEEGLEQRTLVAFVELKGDQSPAPAELRSFLRSRLPETMVPEVFTVLAALPRSAHGKVDRRALPTVSRPAPVGDFMSPRSVLEEVLAEMWAELLQLERVGVTQDFFELGGNSLLGAQLVARLRRSFAARIPMRVLFGASTVTDLAAALVAHEAQPGEMERTAVVLRRLRQLAPEERERLLAAKRGLGPGEAHTA